MNLVVKSFDVKKQIFQNYVFWYALLAIAGMLFAFLTFYPGWINADARWQYSQALTGDYGDWHPVMMAWWWSILKKVHPGPAMYLLQNQILYWGGLFLISVTIHKHIKFWAFLILLAGFMPSALLVMAEVIKDSVFTSAMLFAIGLTYHSVENKKMSWWRLCILLLILAFAWGVKTNGVFRCALVLAWWALCTAFPNICISKKGKLSLCTLDNTENINVTVKTERQFFTQKNLVFTQNLYVNECICALKSQIVIYKKRILLFFCLCFAILVLPILIMSCLKITHYYPMQYQHVEELYKIGLVKNQILLPSYIVRRIGITKQNANKFYNPYNIDSWYCDPWLATLYPDDIRELKQCWYMTVKNYPWTYLYIRAKRFYQQLFIQMGKPDVYLAAYPSCGPGTKYCAFTNPWGFYHKLNPISEFYIQTQFNKCSFLYSPWIYIFISIVAAVVAFLLNPKYKWILLVLSSNVIFFTLPHFFVLPAAWYRYLHFSVVCGLIQFAILSAIFSHYCATAFFNSKKGR